jgi:GNAT acetyltransferase-like protein
MKNNPFTSHIYTKTWSKHFNQSKKELSFSFINGVSFVRNKLLSYYENIGRNLTSGIFYSLSNTDISDYKNKTFLIRDIPSYYNLDEISETSPLKLKKIFQYEGYKIEMKEYDDIEHYIKTIFKSNSRSKLRKNIKRLEACFDVKYVMYRGEISKEDFNIIFNKFYELLERRYANKQESCGELNPVLWSYYCELAYAMILEKTASLYVIYNDIEPIGIMFNYHFDNILIEGLKVLDIDYLKFNIGHTTTYKLIDWCFKNNIETYDFTYGDFEHKRRWSSSTYRSSHHLFYDSKSIKSRLLAKVIENYFNFKRIIREKKLIKKYHDLRHRLSINKHKDTLRLKPYKVELESVVPPSSEMILLDINSDEYMSQRKAIYDYLYMHPEPANTFKLFKSNKISDKYYAFGENSTLYITR